MIVETEFSRLRQLFNKATLAGLLFGAAAMVSASAASAQSTAADADGVWSAVYNAGSGNFVVRLDVIDGLGRLEFHAPTIAPILGTCQYVFDVKENRSGEMHLRTGTWIVDRVTRTAGSGCPQEMPFSFQRTEAERLTVDFAAFDMLPQAVLFSNLRPPRQDDAAPEIAGLDILGVSPGLTEADVGGALTEQGFEEIASSHVTCPDGSNRPEAVSFGRERVAESDVGPSHGFLDVITVNFAVVCTDGDGPSEASSLLRTRVFGEDENVSVGQLESAFLDKYGPPVDQNGDEWRSYTLSGETIVGRQVAEQTCTPPGQPHQRIPFRFAMNSVHLLFPTYPLEVRTYCGPQLYGQIFSDPSVAGRAASMSLLLVDPVVVWSAFWQNWAQAERAEIKGLFDQLAANVGDAPEL